MLPEPPPGIPDPPGPPEPVEPLMPIARPVEPDRVPLAAVPLEGIPFADGESPVGIAPPGISSWARLVFSVRPLAFLGIAPPC
jgi:hypothetical protein